MVAFKGGDNITIQAEGSGNLNQIRWKIDRDPSDSVDNNGLPTLSSQVGASVTLTTSKAGNFRLISYYDTNSNGTFDNGEELKVLRFAVVLITMNQYTCFIKNTNQFQFSTVAPLVFNNNVEVECPILLAGGGSNGTIGLDKIRTGVIGNVTNNDFKVFYETGVGTSTSNGVLPLISDPNSNNAFRSNSVENIGANPPNGQQRLITSSTESPSTNIWVERHPANQSFWQSSSGGYRVEEFVAAYSETFPQNYVVAARGYWSISFDGVRDSAGNWLQTSAYVNLQGYTVPNSNSASIIFTPTVQSDGSVATASSQGVVVNGTTYDSNLIYSQ